MPFKQCPYPSLKQLNEVSVKCRRALLVACKPSTLKGMVATVQIVLLSAVSALAVKRPESAQEAVVALCQAADYVKTLGASEFPWQLCSCTVLG